MHALIPDEVTGSVEIFVALADPAGEERSALMGLVSTWMRAVQIGLLGSTRTEVQGKFEAHGREVAGRLRCEHVPPGAFQALAGMIRHFSSVKGQLEEFTVLLDGHNVVPLGKPPLPVLPRSTPFIVEFPEDLKRYVRVEIEFLVPLAPRERDAVFDALSVWDALIETLEEESWGKRSEYRTRLLSPAMVEHEVEGYFGRLESLHYIVLMGLRLHRRLSIERITME